MDGKILRVEGLTVSFDGFKALDGLDFDVEYGELRFLIGPNGAGKSTLLDVISGRVKPAQGRVRFRGGTDICKRQEHEIVRLGIGRKFQTPAVFVSLTVWQNLELAIGYRNRLASLFRSLDVREADRIENALQTIGLDGKAHDLAGSLSHGEKQWLEIGMLLVQEPKLMLLDEPVAGMTRAERARTGELLQRIAKDRSVLVVEHDMQFVRQFSRKVTVMHEGRILSEGPVDQVQTDSRVIEIYLGRGAQQSRVPANRGVQQHLPALAD